MFGHTRGAFTGASRTRRGFVSQADGGTLVLDEVGELPLAVQAKLLRTLQGGEIQPLGASRVERVNVRVVACTNRDLELEAREGRFRMDLYYRLAVAEFLVPPLRANIAKTFPRSLPNSPVDMARMVALGTGNEIGPEAFRRAANESGAEPLPEGMLSLPGQVEALERSLIA